MGAETRFPLTRMEIAERFGTDVAYFPATFEEYWEVVKEAEYMADFYQHQIIIPMSYESNNHSKIAVEISFILKGSFRENDQYEVHNSNRPLYFPDCKENGAVFNPDASVILLPRQPFEYQKGFDAETTPEIIVEVLSHSTQDYDYAIKLPCYKKCPTVQQIIFISSLYLFATVWTRQGDTDVWLNSDHDRPDDIFLIHQQAVRLGDLYTGVDFGVE